jgi:copper chaperone
MKKISVRIEGMHCGSCTAAVKAALVGVTGVASADVEVGTASVVFDDTQCRPPEIVSAISNAGSFQVAGFDVQEA